MGEKSTDNAESQARSQLECIMAMVARVEHCDECDGPEECELTDHELAEGINQFLAKGNAFTPEDRAKAIEEYHDREAAEEAIQEDPLSVQIRDGWHTPGVADGGEPEEYEILLCTGGPACRIVGKLGSHCEPETADLQFQDWFTPWESLDTSREEEAALLAYASRFYFGD